MINPYVLYEELLLDLNDTTPIDHFTNLEIQAGDSVTRVRCKKLASSFLKKFEEANDRQQADERAVGAFVSCNDEMEAWCLGQPKTTLEAIALGEAQDAFYKAFVGAYDLEHCRYENIVQHLDFGSGACLGASDTTTYHKLFQSRITATNDDLVRLYNAWVQCNPTLLAASEVARSQFGDPVLVTGSKLQTVPKNSEISRAICIEPILNMFFQKGIAGVLSGVLKRSFGIVIEHQEKLQQHHAFIGSLTGESCTIDFSQASDRIPLKLMMDPAWLPPMTRKWLEVTRSESVTIPGKGNAQLHMVSSMGNAFTFPLMTILLSACIVGCYRALDIQVETPKLRKTLDGWCIERYGNFGVFGDDVVIDRRAYDLFMTVTSYLGFKPNPTKSFRDEDFRESCGLDYYQGFNVRGIYLKTWNGPQDCFTLFNLLTAWASNNEIPLPRTLSAIFGQAPKTLVPLSENVNAGFRVPFRVVGSPKRVTKNGWNHIVYTRWVPSRYAIPYEILLDPSGDAKRKLRTLKQIPYTSLVQKVRRLRGNPDACLCVASKGELLNGVLGLRNPQVRYTKSTGVVFDWDYVDWSSTEFTYSGWTNWVTSESNQFF